MTHECWGCLKHLQRCCNTGYGGRLPTLNHLNCTTRVHAKLIRILTTGNRYPPANSFDISQAKHFHQWVLWSSAFTESEALRVNLSRRYDSSNPPGQTMPILPRFAKQTQSSAFDFEDLDLGHLSGIKIEGRYTMRFCTTRFGFCETRSSTTRCAGRAAHRTWHCFIPHSPWRILFMLPIRPEYRINLDCLLATEG